MKAHRISSGGTVAVVSLSSGMLGESFCAYELAIAQRRLEAYGFRVKYMPHALKGIEYLKAHPEARAQDLLAAFEDEEAEAVICAIGGDDTYRLAPYLFEGDALRRAVEKNPKIFLGFSDTTVNHMMLYQCGLNTFYGQALLPDVAEIDKEMLPFTRACFEELFLKGEIKEIHSSPIWYDERLSFDESCVGTPRVSHEEKRGFDVISGSGKFRGRILGGCVESICDMLTGDRYSEEKGIVEQYGLFPRLPEWQGKILLLESSEEQPEPECFERMLGTLKDTGIFDVVSGVIAGKPMDEKYYEEYRELYRKVIDKPELSVVYNVNVGHATPRCIVPFGVMAEVDGHGNRIAILEDVLE